MVAPKGAGVLLRVENLLLEAIGVLAYFLTAFQVIVVVDIIIASSISYLSVNRLLDL